MPRRVGDSAQGRLRQPAGVLFLRNPERRDDGRARDARTDTWRSHHVDQVVALFEKANAVLALRGDENGGGSTVDLPEHDVQRAQNGGDVGQHVAAADRSIACRCAKPGAVIFRRYGLLVPSDTRYTPNSPLGASTAGVNFTGRDAEAFGVELEVMDQRFHRLTSSRRGAAGRSWMSSVSTGPTGIATRCTAS